MNKSGLGILSGRWLALMENGIFHFTEPGNVTPKAWVKNMTFFERILETGFNAWFQISLAALIVDKASGTKQASVAYSICSSFLTATLFIVCKLKVLYGISSADRPFLERWNLQVMAFYKPFSLLFALILFAAMAARVVASGLAGAMCST